MSRAARGFATNVGTSNVKQVDEDPREIRSAVDYLNCVLIAYPGTGSFWSYTPSSILKLRGTPRPRGDLAAGSNTLIPGSVGADLMLSGVYHTLI